MKKAHKHRAKIFEIFKNKLKKANTHQELLTTIYEEIRQVTEGDIAYNKDAWFKMHDKRYSRYLDLLHRMAYKVADDGALRLREGTLESYKATITNACTQSILALKKALPPGNSFLNLLLNEFENTFNDDAQAGNILPLEQFEEALTALFAQLQVEIRKMPGHLATVADIALLNIHIVLKSLKGQSATVNHHYEQWKAATQSIEQYRKIGLSKNQATRLTSFETALAKALFDTDYETAVSEAIQTHKPPENTTSNPFFKNAAKTGYIALFDKLEKIFTHDVPRQKDAHHIIEN